MRWLMFLFGKDYEPCKTCEMLRSQLAIANTANRDLHLLLVDIFKPKVELPENTVNDTTPFRPRMLPSRRRAIAEENERRNMDLLMNSKNIARESIENKELKEEEKKSEIPIIQPKTIEELEQELAIGGE